LQDTHCQLPDTMSLSHRCNNTAAVDSTGFDSGTIIQWSWQCSAQCVIASASPPQTAPL
jgi:hypothetical protein